MELRRFEKIHFGKTTQKEEIVKKEKWRRIWRKKKEFNEMKERRRRRRRIPETFYDGISRFLC